jgi:hypothetical protein
MARCKIYGTKPYNGPGHLPSRDARMYINETHPSWQVSLVYDAPATTVTYASRVATEEELVAAFAPIFPGYFVYGFA